jgi:hypothetical protein
MWEEECLRKLTAGEDGVNEVDEEGVTKKKKKEMAYNFVLTVCTVLLLPLDCSLSVLSCCYIWTVHCLYCPIATSGLFTVCTVLLPPLDCLKFLWLIYIEVLICFCMKPLTTDRRAETAAVARHNLSLTRTSRQ